MDEKLIEQIYQNMEEKSTEELNDIWTEYNTDEWSEEAFEAVYRVLVSRGEKPSSHLPKEKHATKEKRLSWQITKFNWLDWLNIILIFIIISFLLVPSTEDSFFIRSFINFGIGIFIVGFYNLTLRRLWARIFPSIYENSVEWVCTACKNVIPYSESVKKCPKCGALF